MPELL